MKYLFGSTSLEELIILTLDQPPYGVKDSIHISQTYFTYISGYIGPHTCTVRHLWSISMVFC